MIGDLDDRFLENCTWYSLGDDQGAIKAVALLFRLFDPPTFIAMSDGNESDVADIINAISDQLPTKLYTHFSPGIRESCDNMRLEKSFGPYHRMVLDTLCEPYEGEPIRSLTLEDMPLIEELYKVAYPGNWFDTSMLIKGHYMGYFDDGTLVGIAGTHIFSPDYDVSALGNIATHPDHRGKGIGAKLTANLCHLLQKHTRHIGLNVKANNPAAIRIYEKVGFRILADFEEAIMDVMLDGVPKSYSIRLIRVIRVPLYSAFPFSNQFSLSIFSSSSCISSICIICISTICLC
jgi:ribosomal protein S18 acetylase RimI-like enzyme